jgi:DNA uptake protein ComE-like DNA-binding protein
MHRWRDYRIRIIMLKALFLTACLLLLSGCFSPDNTRSLQEHTADATAAAKRDAGAIARGVAEGLMRKGPLDINQASAKQLATLPGVTPEMADTIIKNRPYASTPELVHKRVLSKSEFNRVKAQIMVK